MFFFVFVFKSLGKIIRVSHVWIQVRIDRQYVGPALGPDLLQRLSAHDKSRRQQEQI